MTTRGGKIPLQKAARIGHSVPTDVLRILLEAGHRYRVGESVEGGQLFVAEGGRGTSAMSSIIFSPELWMERGDSVEDDRAWRNLCLCLQAAGASRTALSSPADVSRMWDCPLFLSKLC